MMVNRRIILFGLIIVLGLTVLTMGKNFINNRLASDEDDEIEVVRSDEGMITVTEENDDGMRKTVLYFKNNEGYLVPVMRRIPWEEGIARATLNNMVDSPELRDSLSQTGLLPIIPAGTEITGITIDEETSICKINFSENFLNNESQTDEESLIKGVVYTLTEFPAIEKVTILVGGKELDTLTHGARLGSALERKDINLVGSLEEGKSKVLVYYKDKTDENYQYFIPMTIPTLAPETNVYSALDILFQGPPEGLGLSSDMPEGTILHGVEISNGTAYVDISYDIYEEESEQISFSDIIKNIGLTLSQFEEIEIVELLVDGETINTTVPAFANEY